MDTLDAPPRTVTLSASAARRLAEIIAAEGNPALMLRLSVSGGGCSGFQYAFALDTTLNEDDHVFERDGVRLVVDEVSLDLLAGSEVEYDDGLMAAHFTVRNPNATASCGCGSSFSV
jgi:iron-sulfur cluster insertion protein